MTASEAYRDGAHRVMRAPALVLGLLITTWLVGLPLALVVRAMVADQLGNSLAAEDVARGADLDWWEEFSSQATGLGQTFTPSIIGFAAVLGNVSSLIDAQPMSTVLAGVVGVWLVWWSFLAGGILDRYARDRAVGARGFFAAAGANVGRLIRLGLIMLVVYWALFTYVHGWLFEGLYRWFTRDLAVERTAMAVWFALYGVFGLILVCVNVVADYARIRLVVEDRHSAMAAVAASLRFVRRRVGRVFVLYALNAAGFLVLLLLYFVAAPGAQVSSPAVWVGLAVGQLYIVGRLLVKLQFYASQSALFQGELAHVGYVAAPLPIHPVSPAEEAIRTT
jgi:hypothetical protein